MKKKAIMSRITAGALALVLGAGALSGALLARAAVIPSTVEVKNGVTVYKNAKGEVDASNLEEGFISVRYTGGKDVRIKVRITKADSKTVYDYDLNNKGESETFPLTEGDGSYTVMVCENTTGTKYALAQKCTLELKLRNEFLPFLYSNQYVNYTAETQVVKKAAELVKEKKCETSFQKMEAIYRWVIGSFTYDKDLAAQIVAKKVTRYLPDLDKVMESKKGICFDYAAVMTAMLRSQGIPCKLVVGYAGEQYHAWINVYIEGTGWVDKAIHFDGEHWTLMDPTYASSSKSDPEILKYIGDNSNYTQKYAY